MDYAIEIKTAKDLLSSGSYNLCSIQCGRMLESALKLLLMTFSKTADSADVEILNTYLSVIRKKSIDLMTLGELNSINDRTNALRKMFNRMYPDHPNKMELDYLNLRIAVLIRNRAAHDSIDDLEEAAGTDAHIIYGSTLKFLHIFRLLSHTKREAKVRRPKGKPSPRLARPPIRKRRTTVEMKPTIRRIVKRGAAEPSIDRLPSLDVCRNKASDKWFIYVESALNGMARMIGPDGRVRTLDIKLFDDKEEMERSHLLSEGLITSKQSDLYDSLSDDATGNTRQKKTVKGKDKEDEPAYIRKYRKMMDSSDTIPSVMLDCIKTAGEICWKDLKAILINQYDYKESGSLSASLRLLEIDGYIEIDGKGEDKTIR